MELDLPLLAAGVAGAGLIGAGGTAVRRRLSLSRAKHPSLAGHPRWSRRIARLLPAVRYDDDRFFDCDGAPADIVDRRRAAFDALARTVAERFARSRTLAAETREGLSDLRFTGAYRVPVQFGERVRDALGVGLFVERSDGFRVSDIDGNAFLDLSGSYGVNLLGHESYKQMIAAATERAAPLGPLLGALHPVVSDNVSRLRALTGLDEVSFHMSGTEAVMQAVQLARYHTGRTHVVRFCGAYHGWWGDVQPGIGNPLPARRTYTLADMSERALRVLRERTDIACVLVNPLQALHPNAAAPSDSTLVAGRAVASADRAAYAAWLRKLAALCRDRGIVFILDDVFTGFRLARGGAAEYYGVDPDMVTFGKTLGGGLPVGVLVGRARWMRRYRDDRPADVNFARGTFGAHPYVMMAMNEFLRRIDGTEGRSSYDSLDARWSARAEALGARLREAGAPLRIAALSTIWCVGHDAPSRYNWMLGHYLRDEGLLLSWVGTGRLIFSLDYDDDAFAEVSERFVRAARRMRADGWWWHPPGATDRTVRRGVLRELFRRRLRRDA
ncbi:MAG: aminotransferase class III-fold pyridoxal phosphate-dependent enzyme [Gluconacetobacter diazotrophicus]|nr:aminotransferase class III-fold pyridoxal phosphate-dependent enzyme [Gluconacetobacter diazotrophicus]